jgi:hypothetical protein
MLPAMSSPGIYVETHIRGDLDEVWQKTQEPELQQRWDLYVGAWRSIMVPEQGRNVPFTIQNYAYIDPLGRETVTWIRTFKTSRRRRFDVYMIYSAQRRRIVDYLGTHQHLAVDIDIDIAPNAGVQIRSGEQRFYESLLGFRFPMALSGVASVNEWYDDADQCFRIQVDVHNHRWGPLFGYRGRFHVEWIDDPTIPASLFPRRVEPRE